MASKLKGVTLCLRRYSLLSLSRLNQAISYQRQPISHRSWNVVRYHHELKQAIELNPNTATPVIQRPTDLLVRVLASSVNPLDIAMTRGYGNTLLTLSNMVMSNGIDRLTFDRLPLTLGRDFVGQIVARGNSVSLYKPGDLVWGTVPPYENGCHADYVVTSECSVSHKPSKLSTVEAAAIPYVGLTAWSAISTFGELTPNNTKNKRVLVLGGSGGVGCFAIQLLKYWGAVVIATCSANSATWLESMTSLDQCVDYHHTREFLEQYPGTFDLILDASSSDAARKNYELISSIVNQRPVSSGHAKSNSVFDRKRTTYVTLSSPLLANFDQYGVVGGSVATLADAIADTFGGIQRGVSFRWAYYLPNQKALAYIGELVERGAIKPFTTSVYSLENAIEAYESMAKRPLNGKVVLQSEQC